MRDIIQLLPDNVANQIAAGEVVQRPASVVKELLENAVDAGAENVQLIVKDSGKTLIQAIDDGKGMSENDLRMAFERHATSKIRDAKDLFHLTTMGFRGEALASIAAVSQVRCSSRMSDEEMASTLHIEGGKLVEYRKDAMPKGTAMEVRNLFFNIPARRQFLKSDQVELTHITDEFQRVALAHPNVGFRFFHNNSELFHLPKGNQKQRIVGVFGKKYDQRLVPVEEQTEHVKIGGFVGKPEAARKKRGEQFFFVNNRFIKSNQLHYAVQKAFEDLLPHGYHPSYFIFIEVNPATIDVNIHPTKTEIKFTDDNMMFNMLASAVKHSLGKHNVVPSLDFEVGSTFTLPKPDPNRPIQMPQVRVNADYNPFTNPKPGNHQSHKPSVEGWQKLMIDDDAMPSPEPDTQQDSTSQPETILHHHEADVTYTRKFGAHYIMRIDEDQVHFIHPRRAHERILFEEFTRGLSRQTIPSQQLLFPQEIELSVGEMQSIQPWLSALASVGFDVDIQGENQLAFYGLPVNLNESALPDVIEMLLTDVSESNQWDETQFHRKLVKNLAKNGAIRNVQHLKEEEVQHLAKALFLCEEPFISLHGKPTVFSVHINELENYFQ